MGSSVITRRSTRKFSPDFEKIVEEELERIETLLSPDSSKFESFYEREKVKSILVDTLSEYEPPGRGRSKARNLVRFGKELFSLCEQKAEAANSAMDELRDPLVRRGNPVDRFEEFRERFEAFKEFVEKETDVSLKIHVMKKFKEFTALLFDCFRDDHEALSDYLKMVAEGYPRLDLELKRFLSDLDALQKSSKKTITSKLLYREVDEDELFGEGTAETISRVIYSICFVGIGLFLEGKVLALQKKINTLSDFIDRGW